MESQGSGGGMRLTGAGKFLLFLVGLACSAMPAGPIAIGSCRSRCRLEHRAATSSTPSSHLAPSTASTPATAARPRRRARACSARIKQTGVMRVGMEPDAPPLHFINDRKQEDGFDFRLAGKIAEALGAKRVQVVEADYEDLPDRLRAGDIDVIMAGYVPDPSIKGVVWSNGYLDFGLCMIVHEGMAAHVPIAVGSGRQAHRDLRRSGGRALGEGEHSQRADQQVLRRRRLVRGGGEGSGRRADLRLPVRRRRDQGASADDRS